MYKFQFNDHLNMVRNMHWITYICWKKYKKPSPNPNAYTNPNPSTNPKHNVAILRTYVNLIYVQIMW